MEIKKHAIALAVALLTLPLCYGAMSYQSDEADRKLASQKPDTSTILHTMKLSALATIDIQREGEAVQPGSEFTLTSKIDLARELPRVRWEWEVPKGITALSPTNGFIEEGTVDPVLTIRLRQDATINKKVKLKLYSTEGRGQMIAMGTYNTLDQDRINADLAALKDRQQRYSEEHPSVSRDK